MNRKAIKHNCGKQPINWKTICVKHLLPIIWWHYSITYNNTCIIEIQKLHEQPNRFTFSWNLLKASWLAYKLLHQPKREIKTCSTTRILKRIFRIVNLQYLRQLRAVDFVLLQLHCLDDQTLRMQNLDVALFLNPKYKG